MKKSTSQNCTPLQLLPIESRGGLKQHIPITFGTTKRMAPATPDFAGNPTYKILMTASGGLMIWKTVIRGFA